MQDRHVDRRWLCGLGLRLLVLLPLLFASAVGCATLPTYDYDTEIDPTKRDYVLGPGDILLFPSGFWHGATMLDEEVVLIDVFSPIREDFLKAGE